MDDSPSRAGLVATAAFLRGHLAATPVLRNPVLDALAGCECFVKAENVQLTGAYKVRGAWAALHARAGRATERRGAASPPRPAISARGGLGASELGLEALIVVPQGTPQTEIDRIHLFRRRGPGRGRQFRARPGARPAAGGRAGRALPAALRPSAGDRRPGHGDLRAAAGSARPRRAGGPLRRRRPPGGRGAGGGGAAARSEAGGGRARGAAVAQGGPRRRPPGEECRPPAPWPTASRCASWADCPGWW